MNEIWNCWDSNPPPTCTVKMVLHRKEMTSLTELVCEASSTLSNLTCLNREAAILSRLLYKNKRIFRHDKAFQNLSKIYQCLKRYLKLNLPGVVQTFKTSLPKEIKSGASHAYLPTRQMLKWLLLRLLAFSQIFARVINLTKDTGIHLYRKLHLGWHLNISLVVYSLTARILIASKFLVMKSIEWYNSLYRYLPYLEETIEFMPKFTLPVNLKKWLGSVDISPLREKTSIDEVFEVIDLVNDEDDFRVVSKNLFRCFRVEVGVDSDNEEVAIEDVKQGPTNLVEDIGVPVIEEEEEEEKKRNKKKKKKKKELITKKKQQEKKKGKAKWSEKLKNVETANNKCKKDQESMEVND